MEGTRNEKVLLIVSAYVIGFITAYIAYGLAYTPHNDFVLSAAVQATTIAEVEPTPQVVGAVSDETSFAVTPDALTVTVNGETRLISINASQLTEEQILEVGTPGIHTAVSEVELSPDGNELYFCEQAPRETTCTEYVYSIPDGTVQTLGTLPSIDPVMSVS